MLAPSDAGISQTGGCNRLMGVVHEGKGAEHQNLQFGKHGPVNRGAGILVRGAGRQFHQPDGPIVRRDLLGGLIRDYKRRASACAAMAARDTRRGHGRQWMHVYSWCAPGAVKRL
jgi:hypothetical protein